VTTGRVPTRSRRARRQIGRFVRAWQSRFRRGTSSALASAVVWQTPLRGIRGVLGRCGPLRLVHGRTRSAVLSRRVERVDIGRLLLGGENGLSAREYARSTGDPMRPSTRVVDGPHMELLRHFAADGPRLLSSEALLRSAYVRNGSACIDATGHFFGARDEAGVLEVARDFLATAGGAPPTARPGRSAIGGPVRVRRIRRSDCFEVLDGHHRIALAAHAGLSDLDVALERGTVTTPVQDLMRTLSWTAGRRELYQPLPAPELAQAWTLIRQCTDRLQLMVDFMEWRDLAVPGSSYLDVGACYGWFVAEMAQRGFDARGLELDPNAARLGALAFGLDPGVIAVGDGPEMLRGLERPADVVSCFSMLHHFVLGAGSCSAEELIELLDRVTGRVLFLDTGEAHEAWFRDLLPVWSSEFIGEWLTAHTTFKRVVALGTDRDSVPPFQDNYGRTLFACTR